MTDYLLSSLPGLDAELVLGMRWHTILGSDLPGRARQLARESRASHYAHAAAGVEAVGVVRLARADRRRNKTIRYSGALAFAGLYPQGRAALCAALPDGRAWLVAVQAGKVLTHTDTVYASMDDAWRALAELLDRHGDGMEVYGDHPGARGQPFGLEALAADLKPDAALKSAGLRWPVLPLPLLVAAAGVLLAFGVRTGWDWHRGGDAPVAEVEAIDPHAAWRDAWAGFASQTQVQSRSSFDLLLGALAGLPRAIGGWGLRSARCEPAAAGGWVCSADYARDRRGATNASFLAARPAGWQTAWRPLDNAMASFHLAAVATTLDVPHMQTRSWHESRTITALQQIVPAFGGITVGDPVPLRIEPPRDRTGAPLPRPASAPSITEQAIALEGPLRSFGLMPAELSGQVSWKAIELHIDPAAEASLNRSRFMAAATGVLYATN